MVRNKSRRGRVVVNTALLTLMAVVFGVATVAAGMEVDAMSRNFRPISDAAHLCFENESVVEDGVRVTEGSYVCTSEIDPATDDWARVEDPTSHSLFLYDTMTMAYKLRSLDLLVMIRTVGGMFSIASLVGAAVYFNHNRE